MADELAKILTPLATPLTALIIVLPILVILYLNRAHFERLLNRISTNASSVEIPNIAKVDISDDKAIAASPVTYNQNAPPAETGMIVEDASDPSSVTEKEQLFIDMFAIVENSRDLAELDAIYEQLQEQESDEKQRIKNRLYYIQLKFSCGDQGALEELEKLTEDADYRAAALRILGFIQSSNNNLAPALDYLRRSLEFEQVFDKRLRAAIEIATINLRQDKIEDFDRELIEVLQTTTDPKELTVAYIELANVYKEADAPKLRLLALEMASRFAPNNTDILFKLAYAYSEQKQYYLALLNYQKLLKFEPHNPMGLNNLGVAYENLKLPIHSNELYQTAIEQGNTLAASNLGVKLIEAGFERLANEVLTTALKEADVHPGVGQRLAELEAKKERETEKVRVVKERATRHEAFLRDYGTKYFTRRDDLPTIAGEWLLKEHDGSETVHVRVEQTRSQIEFEFSIALSTYQIKGTIRNSAIVLSRYKAAVKNDQLVFVKDVDGLGVITDNDQSIRILFPADSGHEDVFSVEHRFEMPIDLTKQPSSSVETDPTSTD